MDDVRISKRACNWRPPEKKKKARSKEDGFETTVEEVSSSYQEIIE